MKLKELRESDLRDETESDNFDCDFIPNDEEADGQLSFGESSKREKGIGDVMN